MCAFQMPMMSPRLPLPDQFATMDTTLGQPVDWNRPARIWCGGGGDVSDGSQLLQGGVFRVADGP